jgi:hypothetical protein
MIKKITNVRFSDSKLTVNNKKIELNSRRSRLLTETDWTQLPDIRLMSSSRRNWRFWRRRVRRLSTQTHTLDEYKAELDKLEKERFDIPIEYEYEPQNLEAYREKLHSLLSDLYHKKTRGNFQPNLDLKYQEILFFAHSNNMYFDTIDELIEILENSDDFELDLNLYPFIELFRENHNCGWRHAMIELLKEQREFKRTCLREELPMLHLKNCISMAQDTDVMIDVEAEILAYYGY